MLKRESYVKIIDNSGGNVGCIIGGPGFSKKKKYIIGDVVRVAIKKAKFNTKVKTGETYLALIVTTKYPLRRKNGTYIFFDSNNVILLNNGKEMIGNTIHGYVPKEFVEKTSHLKVNKLLSSVEGGIL
ncbi:hypothetical protein AB836_01860 [Rickettsiales bacterium (ex Bugula neritina AB1)]|nr:hypothetical protein AB836_01860 [Rickettsiales bacterium (ex Bugula neritina AB1)]